MLLNTLVNPGRVAINRRAEAAHGVTAPMLRGAPSLADLWPQIRRILSGNRVVIYNAKFDRRFFPDNLACAGLVECAMQALWPRDILAGSAADAYTGQAHTLHQLPTAVALALFALYSVVLIPVSWATWRWIEEPSRQWFKRQARRGPAELAAS